MTIQTARLQLAPYSPHNLLALIEGVDEFAESFGLPAADGLREFYVSGDVSPAWLEQLRAAAAPDPWVHGFAVVHRASQSVIGALGFKGRPGSDGVVEIAYGIVPMHQRQGYATEAATAGCEFAAASGLVRAISAHTMPEANASTCVLTRCGFSHVAEIVDPDDGLVWRWERVLPPAS